MITEEQFQKAIALIDAAHNEDTTLEDGKKAELLYSERMLQVLAIVAPDASDELKLAAKVQHMQRWGIPRDTFPIDKKGYYQWRAAVMEHQLSVSTSLLTEAEIPAESIEIVVDALKNKNDKTNVNASIIEDTACLVFIKWYLTEFIGQFDNEKAKNILVRTAKKMSAHGLSLIPQLDLHPEVLEVLRLLED